MGVLYIDRGFISVNGVEVLDVQDITLRVNDNTKYAPTMTRNRRYKGTVKGNRDVNLHVGTAVQSSLGTAKLENIDYQSNSVALTFEHGGDRYSCVGLDHVDMEQSAPGVGSEGKKGWNFLATDIIDQVGNSALFPTSLSSITG
jgi:hypothetical protein